MNLFVLIVQQAINICKATNVWIQRVVPIVKLNFKLLFYYQGAIKKINSNSNINECVTSCSIGIDSNFG